MLFVLVALCILLLNGILLVSCVLQGEVILVEAGKIRKKFWSTLCCYRLTISYFKLYLGIPFYIVECIWFSLLRSNYRIDLKKYYQEFCMESDYPDQIKYDSIGGLNYTKKKGPLPLARRFKSVESTFDFDGLHTQVFARFVQLLPSLTLSYLSIASKNLYYQCLDIRGLEYSFYSPSTFDDSNYKNHKKLSKNGRRMGYLKDANPKLMKFVICRDTFMYAGGPCTLSITYKQLILVNWKEYFGKCYKHQLQYLLHERVESVKLIIRHPNGVEDTRNPDPKFSNLLDFLRICKNVKKIGVSMHAINRTGIDTLAVRFASHPEFEFIKAGIENWAKTRPDLLIFKFIYINRCYMIHENVLKKMEKYSINRWCLVEKYPVRDMADNEAQDHWKCLEFFRNLECPYGFAPYCYEKYWM